ncbi:MAG: hypothetical protein H6693_01945 [Candidatus Latescibacteria bacterium]|nr:hypothetical protein [Candidatus Latescibacterota bacterium]
MALRARALLASVALLAAFAGGAQAQGSDDDGYGDYAAGGYDVGFGELLHSSQVVDSPTATVLAHGHYRIRGRLMDGGSLVAATSVGIKDRFEVGVSWGMQGLLGRGEVEFNDRTALSLRLLLIPEMQFPSLLIGFDSQGYGAWDPDLERYERKSKGFYACLTRNWYGPMGTDVATTAGINYSTEDKDESSVDFFFGFEQDFDRQFALLLDYSAGLDDREQESPTRRYGSGKGWLDLGLRWNVVGPVQFKFFFRDLLSNYRRPSDGGRDSVDRQFEISYEGSF